jgi:hypothetical protein
MKKIASFVSLTVAAAALSAGCAVDVADEAALGGAEEALCPNPEGTNLMLATLAVAIAKDMNRWNLVGDFEKYRGYNNQEMIRIKSASRTLLCGASTCANVDAILALQDSRNDQKIVFSDGTKLSSWTFAARLVAGWDRQKTCEDRKKNGDPNSCSSELHYLTYTDTYPGTCDGGQIMMTKFAATKGNSNGTNAGGALQYPAQLQNKLIWAENGNLNTNPYLQFNVLPGGLDIEIDPGQCMTGDPGCVEQGSGTCANAWQACQRFSVPNIVGQCCTCPLPNNGGTKTGVAAKVVGSNTMYTCN